MTCPVAASATTTSPVHRLWATRVPFGLNSVAGPLWKPHSLPDSAGSATRTLDASRAWRSAPTAWGVGSIRTAFWARMMDTSGSEESSSWLSAARTWDRAVLALDTAWFLDTSATSPRARATTATATLVASTRRLRRALPLRLANT